MRVIRTDSTPQAIRTAPRAARLCVLGLLALFAIVATSCTKVTLRLSVEGEGCSLTEECEVGLVCSDEGVCASLGGSVDGDALGDSDGAPIGADAGTGDAGAEPDEGGSPTDVLSDGANQVPDGLTDAEGQDTPQLPLDVPQDGLLDDGGGHSDVPPDTVNIPDAPDGQELPSSPDVDDLLDGSGDVPGPGPDTEPGPDAGTTGDAADEEVDAGGAPALPAQGELCDGPCQPGLVCMPQLDDTAICDTLPDGLCLPCDLDDDCPGAGATCNELPGGERFCGTVCGAATDCPSGFICQSGQCWPETQTCSCGPALIGFTLGCINQSPDGTCTGKITCQLNGWSKCSAKPAGAELCDGIDNDCDGFIDEAPFYIENGQPLAFGSLCGVGECVGGEVICAPDGSATCSTNGFATPEACADNLDNNCDGFVNEDCDSLDFDGDGVPNDLDCSPFDAAYHAGAPESCCPGTAFNPACDTNCDGNITPCAPCDGDGDGFCPPEDCDDTKPDVNPDAPDKCNDGFDQDCAGGDLTCNVATDADKDGWIPPGDCNEGNPGVHPGAIELCDNLDNDCDGVTDEGNPQAGQICGSGPEYCQAGTMVCTHYPVGAAIQCQGAIILEEEKCDGIDNDCSGGIDEPFADLGLPCDGPDVDACANGITQCLGNGLDTFCGEETVTNILEVCNDIDDDCDGATDEFVCPLYDLDGDGFSVEQGDCDDSRAEKFPGAPEPCCDPTLGAAGQEICDLDCNQLIIPCAFGDADSDGFTVAQGDCDDGDPQAYPGAPEKCDDGLDQDCDELDLICATVADADFDGFHSGVDCNDTNNKVNPWATETCNFIDDDCDGLIDEGNPTGKVGTCGPDVPECAPGTWVCVHDIKTSTVQVLCVTPSFQADEICNALDDDCDFEVDESFFELGLPCDGPDGDLCENGQLVCNGDGSGLTCGVEEQQDLVEVCDTADNDCDGETDEGLEFDGNPLGGLCDGTGECGPGVVMCSLLSVATCSTNSDGAFSQAELETCNGKDDDCDGLTDEAFAYKGLAIGAECEGIGACGAGVVECGSASEAVCSTDALGSQSQATDEICDGSDNNCDGHVDEDLGLEQSSCAGVGVCTGDGGSAECKAGQWICDFSAIGDFETEEVSCDGLDNDCDGETDEGWDVGLPCDGDDSDACANGTWECHPFSGIAQCTNETVTDLTEQCDGTDTDCDGLTDELDVSPSEAGCITTGVCDLEFAIVVSCSEVGLQCDYSGIAGWEPEETLCDEVDNDCDGLTDEFLTLDGAPIGAACEGSGVCSQGFVECNVFAKKLICSTEAGGLEDQSKPEQCNGKDDDCDGETDEPYHWLGSNPGEACDGLGGCGAVPGVVECAAGGTAAACSTMPGGSNDQSTPEQCNGIDDDCDGLTDEPADLDPSTAPCAEHGVCQAANPICQLGSWSCQTDEIEGYQAFENQCDDLDNDCDGEVDEHLPLKDAACDGPDADLCATGTWECHPEGVGLVCANETGEGTAEVCDGVDNDCDGSADNGISYGGIPVGQPCLGEGQCAVGFVECNDDKVATCSSNPDGSSPEDVPETCNSKDDDCDGVTDDGLFWEGVEVGSPCDGIGMCGGGFVVCSDLDGEPTCSTNPNGPTPGGASEWCDGIDNDCDGDTDEDFPQFQQRCDGDDADSCMTGFFLCLGGGLTCVKDTPCAFGAVCVTNAFPNQEWCSCQGVACSLNEGDQCGGGGCSCAGGAPCIAPQKCTPGVGCE